MKLNVKCSVTKYNTCLAISFTLISFTLITVIRTDYDQFFATYKLEAYAKLNFAKYLLTFEGSSLAI